MAKYAPARIAQIGDTVTVKPKTGEFKNISINAIVVRKFLNGKLQLRTVAGKLVGYHPTPAEVKVIAVGTFTAARENSGGEKSEAPLQRLFVVRGTDNNVIGTKEALSFLDADDSCSMFVSSATTIESFMEEYHDDIEEQLSEWKYVLIVEDGFKVHLVSRKIITERLV